MQSGRSHDLFPSGLVDDGLLHRADRHSSREALADPSCKMNYGEVASTIRRLAGLLVRLGLSRGERVIVALGNSVDQIIFHYAVLYAGGVVVPLSAGLPPGRLAFYIRDAEPMFIVSDEADLFHAVPRTGDAWPSLITSGKRDRRALADLRDAAGEPEVQRNGRRGPSDLAALLYTTGSTGQPKAVMLSHKNVTSALASIVRFVGYGRSERELVVLPVSHSFGLGHVYCNLTCGGFVRIDDGLKRLKRVLGALVDDGITGFPCTPAMLQLLLGRYREAFTERAKGLRFMVVNTAPLPPEVTSDLLSALPDLRLLVYYGLTEASRSTFIDLSAEGPERYRSVGPAASGVDIAIMSPEGTPRPAGSEGEVWVRGEHLASGYWRREAETQASFADGWLRTGDLGRMDEAGYLTLTGRIGELINVGGLKVSPSEIERIVGGHPAIADAAAAEVKDPMGIRGSVVGVLAVVSDPGLKESDLRAFCAGQVESFMMPEVIRFAPSVPRAESGKILRSEVKALLEG